MTVSGFSLQLYKNWELATLLGKPQMNTLYLETLTLKVLLRYIIYIYIYIFSIWVFFNSAVYFFDVFTVFLSFVLFCLVAAYKKGLF